MNKKIVVLTGSFNPITKAHRMILENAINKIDADLGLFVMVSDDYLKNKIIIKKKEKKPFILSENMRKEMIESVTKAFPKIKYGGIEVGGVSPATVKTLRKIKRLYKDYDLYFSVGADKLKGISHWSEIETIFNEMRLIVYQREGYDIEKIVNDDNKLLNIKDRIIVLDDIVEAKGISSSKLRVNFFGGINYKEFMDDGPYELFSKLNPNDYTEITGEDLIKCHLLYGGRFGGNAARKQVYLENVKILNNWDETRLGNRNDKILNTKVYTNEFKHFSENNYITKFKCENIDCVDAGKMLIDEGLNPVILNQTTKNNPCGDYFGGSGGQEESLCQMSTLSISLYQFANPKLKCFKEANVTNIPNVYPLDINYGGIYSPNVCFFRNNIENSYSLRDKTFECSVISVSSISNKLSDKEINEDSIYFNEEGYLNSKGTLIMKNKIRTIFRIALDNNHDSVVLGKFGCGELNLKYDEVSNLFKEVLEEVEFKNKFKVIFFSLYEGKGSSRRVVGENGLFKPFYDLFISND